MNNPPQLKIDQTLHGYANGHSLLASSITLPTQPERIMLILSDMSGHSMLKGFEKYITGYPIPEINKYVLARTWYAPEMVRPGCVWTHSLIIDFSDLSQIKDIRSLIKLFKRPRKSDTFFEYKESLIIDPNFDLFYETRNLNKSWSKLDVLLSLIYENPSQPIYLSTNDVEDVEDLILSVWNQQWPRLKRSFSFSTGSLSIRKLATSKFDLQVIPTKIEERLAREGESGIVFNLLQGNIGNYNNFPKKYSIASKYILFPENFKDDILTKFLWSFGSEFSDGRVVFPKLLDVFITIQNINNMAMNLQDLLKITAKYFPNKLDAISLKNTIFGSELADRKWILPSVMENHLLNDLCNTDFHSIFDIEQLKIRPRAKKLWENFPSQAKQITIDLIQNPLTPIGLEFIIGIAEIIDPSELVDISSINKQCIYTFIKYKPGLAASSEIWQATSSEQYDLLKIITEITDISEKTIGDITLAILKSGSDSIIEEFMSFYSEVAVRTIFDWVNGSENISINCITKAWKSILKTKPQLLLKWMKETDKKRAIVQALIANLLSPNSEEVLEEAAELWLPLAQVAYNDLPSEMIIDTMAFLLAVGYNNPGKYSDKLVAESFEIVHEAVRKDSIKESNWQFFKAKVPELYWWQDWDRCERLRRGFVERFIKYDWPLESFTNALQNPSTFSKVVEFCYESRQGKLLLKNIKEQMQEGSIVCTKEQINILKEVKYLG